MLDIVQNSKTIVEIARLEKIDRSWNTANPLTTFLTLPFARLYFPIEGEAEMYSHNLKYHLRPGRIFLLPPYMPFEVKCESYMIKYWTHFNVFMKSTDVDVFNLNFTPVELPVKNPEECRICFEHLIKYHSIARSEWNPKRRLPPIGEIEVNAALNLLLAPFYEAMLENSDNNSFANIRLIKLLNFIEDNLEKELSLRIMAEFTHLSPTYLSNMFAKRFRIPLMQYCNLRRIVKAADLLAYSDYPVEEIAWRQGAENSASFARLFKRHTGESPQCYRRRIRSANQKNAFA